MKRLLLILTVVAATALGVVSAAPLREVRAAWIVTRLGLDWPRQVTDTEEQKRLLTEMLDRLAAANFNTVYVQMQTGGDVLWDSMHQPAAADVTGDGAHPLSYDVARFIIDESRCRGMDCYAIIEPFDVGTFGEAQRYADNRVKHPIAEHPELLTQHDGRYYLDPLQPETLDYLEALYTELVTAYDFDGILVDAPLYPAADTAVARTQATEALSDFVRDLAGLISEYRPSMKLLLATEGIPYIADDGSQAASPDYLSLIEEGYVDMVVPKLFARSDYGFMPALESWSGGDLSPRTIPAVTLEDVVGSYRRAAPDVNTQIELARDDERLAGVAVYRASAVCDTDDPVSRAVYRRLRDDTFRYPAHLPETPWSPSKPYAPENVVAITDDYGNYIITWDEATPAADGTEVKYYSVYVARDGEVDMTDPRGVVAHRVEGTRLEYPSLQPGLEFAVTTFDTNNYESAPALSGRPAEEAMNARDYVFRYYADVLYVAAPKTISRLDIYNSWGGHVKSVRVGDYEVAVECGDLDGGVYVVHTVYSEGSRDVNKFIK